MTATGTERSSPLACRDPETEAARSESLIIVGGGPAGAAAACFLARAGHAPLLIERDTSPRHKICGEFVSVEAQAYLGDLGIDPLALGGAPITRVRIAVGSESVGAALPFRGVGLTRRRLDAALQEKALDLGARIRRGDVVRTVTPSEDGLDIRLRGGWSLGARTVFLANGKHDLNEPRRPVRPVDDLIGFKTYFALAPEQRQAIEGTVEVILFEGGYAGLQPVEGGMANLCLLVQRPVFERAGKRWDRLIGRLCRLSPHLGARLAGATPLLPKPLSISQIPYGFVHRPSMEEPEGLFRLGDQMGVIPSFCGDGIAIALHSAHLSAAMYHARGNVASAYHRAMSGDVVHQIQLASALYGASRAAMAQRALLAMFRLFPGLVKGLAAWTRIPANRIGRG
jgi:flavin-dependent dehydrogenase